jgi:anti-anti-sigma regulatory factor
VDDTVAPSTMAMAICQIERRACTTGELVALRDTHEVLVEVDPEFSDEVLTIVRTFDPPGLRVEGELDSARHAVFDEKLRQVVPGRHAVHLDLSRLTFIDLGGLHLLTRYAAGPGRGRRLVLDHLPPDVETVIDMVGWHRLPGIHRGRGCPGPPGEFGGPTS